MRAQPRGRLIAVEGIDGSGKSTQAARLASRLGAVLTFEPGATALGGALRPVLLERHRSPITVRAEALLMAADRAQHVDEVIGPALDRGTWVVTDRYSASTLAYQGYGRGLDRAGLDLLVEWATDGVVPDATVLIDLPVDVAVSRRGGEPDRMEAGGYAFARRVAEGYRRLADGASEPWITIDGSGTADQVEGCIWERVSRLFGSEALRGTGAGNGIPRSTPSPPLPS